LNFVFAISKENSEGEKDPRVKPEGDGLIVQSLI
jgi:hypothetical protein